MEKAKERALHAAADPWRSSALHAAENLLPSDTAGPGCCWSQWAQPLGSPGAPQSPSGSVPAQCAHSGVGRSRALEKGAREASTPGVLVWGGTGCIPFYRRPVFHFSSLPFSHPSCFQPCFPLSSDYFQFPSQRESKTQRFARAPG